MKKIEETKVTIVGYEAFDGKRFTTEDECRKYEKEYKLTIEGRYKSLVIGRTDELALFNCGYEDNDIDIVRIKDESDLAVLNVFLSTKDGNKAGVEVIGTDVLVGFDSDHYCAWLWSDSTIDKAIETIRKNYAKAIETFKVGA